jgi:hypothetical protein
MQNPEAHCDPGEKVLGTGAQVSLTNGQVGLQVARASTTGNWSYAFAHEDPDGYQYGWYSWAYAVCAPEPAGYDVINAPSAYRTPRPRRPLRRRARPAPRSPAPAERPPSTRPAT